MKSDVVLSQGVSAGKLQSLSLGEGQEAAALKMIQDCSKTGSWLMLHNCHLAAGFMPSLEKASVHSCLPLTLGGASRLFKSHTRDNKPRHNLGSNLGATGAYSQHDENTARWFRVLRVAAITHLLHACDGFTAPTTHPDFRLWLVTQATDTIPISLLHSAVKIASEQPRTLRDTLRSFAGDGIEDPELLETCQQPQVLKKLLYGMCFFHAMAQERLQFGAIGWNVPYHFTDIDLRLGSLQLHALLEEYKVTTLKIAKQEISFFLLKHFGPQLSYWLERSPRLSSRRTGFDSRRGHAQIFACRNPDRRCHWSAGFLRDLPLPPPLNFGTDLYPPNFILIELSSPANDCHVLKQEVPLEAVRYLAAECIYGSRVTDEWDHRIMRTILGNIYHEQILNYDTSVSGDSGVYQTDKRLSCVEEGLNFFQELPFLSLSLTIGLDNNAYMVRNRWQTDVLLSTLLMNQVGAAEEDDVSREDRVLRTATEMLDQLAGNPDVSAGTSEDHVPRQPLEVVLLQEVECYSLLLATIRSSLTQLCQALRGEYY
ncbi:hypothetical protein PR048_008362, partial [Dryococelus australis]